MKRSTKWLVILVIGFLFAIIVVPLILPLPPLAGTGPAESLADPDSRFIQVNGMQVHYKQYGSGSPAIILLHGFGSSTFSWREVVGPLSQKGTVIAYDRPAFGLTERPLPGSWKGDSPYGAKENVQLLFGLMDALKIQNAILVGNSAGGTVAIQAALQNSERVKGLVLVDPAVYTAGGTRFGLMAPFVNTPQMNRVGPYLSRTIASDQGTEFMKSAWHDPTKITSAITAGYRKFLNIDDWDVALWEYTKAGTGNEGLADRLKELKMPVLVITGDDDQIIPTNLSVSLSGDIPGAKLALMPACGHVPQEECPQPFLNAVDDFIASLAKSQP
jgi:pimeloyl-ACP methyl ester carboxylesterase